MNIRQAFTSAVMTLVTHLWGGELRGPLYINYSVAPRAGDLLKYPLCILDAAAQVDMAPAQKLGHEILAYVSAVELGHGAAYKDEVAKRGVPLIGRNETWKSDLMDVTSPAWAELMLAEDGLIAQALTRGFDGVFFDTVDSTALMPAKQKKAASEALVDLFLKVRREWPGKRIVLNRGFDLLPMLRRKIDGVLVESVLQTYDFGSKQYVAVSDPDRNWIKDQIVTAQKLGFQILAVDYVHPIKHDLAARTAAQLRALGTIPLITTPELKGRVLNPGSAED